MENKRFSQRHEKRKEKTNRIYNVLIAVVAVLIVFVGGSLMMNHKDKPADTKTASSEVKKDHKSDSNKSEDKSDKSKADDDQNKDDQSADDQSSDDSTVDDQATEDEQSADDESQDEDKGDVQVTENNDPSSDVDKTVVDPNWKPVGTEQQGEHVATYEKGSTDWNEMLKAVSSATGVSESDMIIWRIGNNGSPQKAVATIESKSQQKKYRVQIDWVDGEGWKPVQMEEMK